MDVAYATATPPEWIVSDLLPVGLTVMSGPPKKAYKSLLSILLAGLAARWPMAALPPWIRCLRSGPSLMLSYEAEAGVINYILEHDVGVRVEPGSIYVAHNPFKFQLDNPEQANQLLDYMDDKEPTLVVMDPFRSMHASDENDSATTIQLLSPLVQWAHNNKASVLMIHHVNKPTEGKDGSSFYSMRGSSALPGLADGLLTIEATKNDGEIVINATFKRGQSYRRLIHLGVAGYGWGARGYEVLPTSVAAVQTEYDKGNHNPESIAVVLRQSIGQVKQALEDLRRNHAIQG